MSVNSLLYSARLADLSSEFNQHDVNHKADIEKLISIYSGINDAFPGIIKSVTVSPATVLHELLINIDKITITIVYDTSDENLCKSEEFVHKLNLIDSLALIYLQDEYPEILDKTDIKVTWNDEVDTPSLLLIYNSDSQINFSLQEMKFIEKITRDSTYIVEIPYNWMISGCKNILLHKEEKADFSDILNHMSQSDSYYGIRFQEGNTKGAEYSYTIVDGLQDLPYKLPYKKLTRNDVDFKLLESEVKEEGSVTQM